MAKKKAKKVKQEAPVSQIRQILARAIAAELERTKQSRQNVADKAGISVRTVGGMLKMSNDPQLDNIDKVAGSLGLTVSQLLLSDVDLTAFSLWSTYKLTTVENRKLIDLLMKSAKRDIPGQGATDDELQPIERSKPKGRRNPSN